MRLSFCCFSRNKSVKIEWFGLARFFASDQRILQRFYLRFMLFKKTQTCADNIAC